MDSCLFLKAFIWSEQLFDKIWILLADSIFLNWDHYAILTSRDFGMVIYEYHILELISIKVQVFKELKTFLEYKMLGTQLQYVL